MNITKKKKLGEEVELRDIPDEIEKLKALMKLASNQLDFEKAIEIRETIAQLKARLHQAKNR